MTAAVDIGSLSINQNSLGKGGFATITQLSNHFIEGERGPFVLKRYHKGVLAKYPGIGASLQSLINHRANLRENDRKRLDNGTIWPLQVVNDNGQVVGLIMRRLPYQYFYNMPCVGGGTKRVTREAQMYFCSPASSRRSGLTRLDLEQRCLALARFGGQLRFLHSKGIVVGDIQGSNVVINPAGNSAAGKTVYTFMLDSDSYRTTTSRPAIPQPSAPQWQPPEITQLYKQAKTMPPGHQRDVLHAQASMQNEKSDVYKFGLFVIRFLAMKDRITGDTNPDIAKDNMTRLFGPQRTATLAAALRSDPRTRPTMTEVHQAITGTDSGVRGRNSVVSPPPPRPSTPRR